MNHIDPDRRPFDPTPPSGLPADLSGDNHPPHVTLPFDILPQPNDTTCGPTCLHALYRYYKLDYPLEQIIAEVPVLETGGTLAVFLACHALKRGFKATIYTYNLLVFDPSWFGPTPVNLRERLIAQKQAKHEPKLHRATEGYIEYLTLGGLLRFEDLTPRLIRTHLTHGRPVLTGLSATYLHRSMREYGDNCDDDDIRGLPAGHFVVLCGYEKGARQVLVADPLQSNPLARRRVYAIGIERVINAILLGVLTYDANLLILEPPTPRKG